MKEQHTWFDAVTSGDRVRMVDEFPWARQMIDCPQDVLYHAEGDVWTHTQMVVDALLAEDTPVSMNLFGFTPDFFTYSREYFKTWLAGNKENLKAEFYIPTMVNKLIGEGTASNRASTSRSVVRKSSVISSSTARETHRNCAMSRSPVIPPPLPPVWKSPAQKG